MDPNICEIESITFGLYSGKEILNMSVCLVDNPKTSESNGTVYDPRMGTTDSSSSCDTCGMYAPKCPGHFGHIMFNVPIIHPLYYHHVNLLLKCFCIECNRFLLQKDQIALAGLDEYKGEDRFKQILKKIEKVSFCCQLTNKVDKNGNHKICGKEKLPIKFSSADNSYFMVYTDVNKTKNKYRLHNRRNYKSIR